MRLFLLFVTTVCVLFPIISFCLHVGYVEKMKGLGKSLSFNLNRFFAVSLNFYSYIFTSSSSVPK